VSEQPTVRVTTTHFQILADRVDNTVLGGIADALESNHSRITSELRVINLPVVSVWVWQDQVSFYADMQTRGPVYYGATGYVRGLNAVSILAGPTVARTAVHEFAHVVSMAVNVSIPNNPRWLWETVALYENREFVDPTTLDYMQTGRYPPLEDLNAAYDVNRSIYQVGYILGEFIVEAWGLDGLVRLVQTNGDLPRALRVTTAEFESAWRAFLHARYGLPAA
jgi:hypothetical protein